MLPRFLITLSDRYNGAVRSVGVVLCTTCAITSAIAACGARSELKAGKGGVRIDAGAVDAREDVPTFDGGVAGAGGMGGMGGMGGTGGTLLDAGPTDCTDPDITYIYVVTTSLQLYAFHPQSFQFDLRGTLDCPLNSFTPFSMGVARTGIAYVIYNDGSLFEVSIKDASCKATDFVPEQSGFKTFGMSYVADDDMMGGEKLYVADIDYASMQSKGLAIIDTDTMVLQPVAQFTNNPGYRIELTADVNEIYAFIIDSQVGGGHLARVDKVTGVMSDVKAIPIGQNIGSWHFALWGGDFYFFTSTGQGNTTSVNKYDPDDESLTLVGTLGAPVVGAGVSTCAPQ